MSRPHRNYSQFANSLEFLRKFSILGNFLFFILFNIHPSKNFWQDWR